MSTDRRSKAGTAPYQSEQTLRKWAILGIVAIVAGMIALVLVQYGTPTKFPSRWGYFSRAGTVYFQHVVLGRTLPPLNNADFGRYLKLCLGVAWAGYALAVVAGLQGATLRPRTVVAVSVGVCLTASVLSPSSLCKDVYGYVAYGRLQAFYGLNPYAYCQKYIRHFHDPTVRFLFWNIKCPYGPLWTNLSIAIVAMFRMSGLFWQVVAFKLLASACLIASAVTGKAIANHFHAGQGNLTFLAIALNPLFLIEGPGSAHNEFLMMGLALLAVLLVLKGKWTAGLVSLGLSVSVKFITLAILPWLVIRRLRGRPLREQAPLAALMVLIALTPIVLLYVPLWDGGAPIKGMQSQSACGLKATTGFQAAGLFLENAGAPKVVASAAVATLSRWWLILLYVGLTAWIWRSKDQANWMVAWIVFSGCVAFFVVKARFPWYFVCPWMLTLTRWDRAYRFLSCACFGFGMVLTMFYGVARY